MPSTPKRTAESARCGGRKARPNWPATANSGKDGERRPPPELGEEPSRRGGEDRGCRSACQRDESERTATAVTIPVRENSEGGLVEHRGLGGAAGDPGGGEHPDAGRARSTEQGDGADDRAAHQHAPRMLVEPPADRDRADRGGQQACRDGEEEGLLVPAGVGCNRRCGDQDGVVEHAPGDDLRDRECGQRRPRSECAVISCVTPPVRLWRRGTTRVPAPTRARRRPTAQR